MSGFHTPGVTYLGENRCHIEVWAPRVKRMEVEFVGGRIALSLTRQSDGGHVAEADGVSPGTRYFFRLDGEQRLPDPASRYQPEGVHGPSEIVDPAFAWGESDWKGVELDDCVIYELHVGTFTRAGTFDAIHEHLASLRELGITAIELMPVAQFPGSRNWGYDGVGLYAVQNSFGGPNGLKRLVDACHRVGIAVILDVVYNHLGPEGNYLGQFAPYFTDEIKTPWGAAINFSGRDSDPVRRFFVENALRWIDEFRIDGLRLDAVHAFHDPTARPFLAELTDRIHERAAELGRRVLVIAESNRNDPRTIVPTTSYGLGCDAQWVDDFHHALHVALTGERHGYYADFDGVTALAKSYRHGFIFDGQVSQYRGRRHGKPAADAAFRQFVVCSQNHDQIGNRMLGERLSSLVDFESLKLAAGAVLLSPFVPMLFMGEEYGETAPFLYFVSHSDEGLVRAVREGRRREFASFQWQGEPADPQSAATYERCGLDFGLAKREPNRTLLAFHAALLRLRSERPSLRALDRSALEVIAPLDAEVIGLRRSNGLDETLTILNFGKTPQSLSIVGESGPWVKLIDSAVAEWKGAGSPAPPRWRPARNTALPVAPRSVTLFSIDRSGGNG